MFLWTNVSVQLSEHNPDSQSPLSPNSPSSSTHRNDGFTVVSNYTCLAHVWYLGRWNTIDLIGVENSCLRHVASKPLNKHGVL